jgi:hypothetical protein
LVVFLYRGMWLVERVGRRPLLIFGGFGMGASHLLIFTFFSLSQSAAKAYAWGAIVAIYMFTICFAVGWGPGKSPPSYLPKVNPPNV